jgi:hypothetical protein
MILPYLASFRKSLLARAFVRPGGCLPVRVALQPRRTLLLSISAVLPAPPGFPNPQPRSPWPAWRGSVAGPVVPMSRKQAAQLWHAARRWDRETHQSGRHGGIIGRTALNVLYVLAFDFLNYTTGRLDPGHDAIAAKVGCCPRTVGTALAKLRTLGMLGWLRRCEEERDAEGRFRLRQRTNAYALLPPSQWRGYRDNAPPPPSPDTLGAPERIPDPIEAAVAELTWGQRKAAMAALEADPSDKLAVALAAFGRAMDERETDGRQPLPGNITPCSNHTGSDRSAAPEPAPRPPDNDEALKRWHIQRLFGTANPG